MKLLSKEQFFILTMCCTYSEVDQLAYMLQIPIKRLDFLIMAPIVGMTEESELLFASHSQPLSNGKRS